MSGHFEHREKKYLQHEDIWDRHHQDRDERDERASPAGVELVVHLNNKHRDGCASHGTRESLRCHCGCNVFREGVDDVGVGGNLYSSALEIVRGGQR